MKGQGTLLGTQEADMTRRRIWTFKAVKAEASKYTTRGKFASGSPAAYRAAWENGWLNRIGLPKSKWTFEAVKAEASKYTTRTKFQKGSGSAYQAARFNRWLDKFFPK